MTSAVLPSINEGQWRNYTHQSTSYNAINPNPNSGYSAAGIGRFVNHNPNPNPNPSRYVQNVSNRGYVRNSDVAPPRYYAPAVDVSSDCCIVEKVTARDGHVIFHLDSYSRSELKELRTRLVSDLERVRSVLFEFESRESEFRSNRSFVQPPSQVNGSVKNGGLVKKSGKVIGQKRTMPISSSREIKREIKRPVKNVVLNSTAIRKVEAAMMRKCGQILSKLMKHKHGWVFNKPVDAVALGLHNYHQVIKHPMDLGTVKTRLGKHFYGTPLEFASDVRLIFDNAMTYNPKGDDAHTMASILLNMFEELFVPAYHKFEAERQQIIVAQENHSKPLPKLEEAQIVVAQVKVENPSQMHSQAVFTNVSPPVQALAAKVVKDAAKKTLSMERKPVPEVQPNAPSRREMNDGERQKLGLILQDLAGEYLNEILQIVAKRNSELTSPPDGEVELDVHSLDSETMWDLDKFVRLHNKAAHNRMRKEVLVNQLALNLENEKSPVVIMEEPEVPTMLKVEEDIDIGDEIPMIDYPPIEIERDAPSPASNVRSSNSSSSSSASDSSSDSDSSSASESEESGQSQEAT